MPTPSRPRCVTISDDQPVSWLKHQRAIKTIAATGLSVTSMIGLAVSAGPFATKEEAKQALVTMRDGPRLFSEIVYRGSVSGKYPPIID